MNAEQAPQAVEPNEEERILFPELDDELPQHKALIRAAMAHAKAKVERGELLTTAKEKEDSTMQKLLALMHECKITKFKHKGVTAEIINSREKATVKLDDEIEEPDQDE
jgi:plasmid stability protein